MKLSLEQSTVDTTMAAIGSKTTYTGAVGTSLSWLFSSEFGIAAGVLLGLLGFALNWYYSRKRDQREQHAHEALMKLHANTDEEPEAKIRQIMRREWENS